MPGWVVGIPIPDPVADQADAKLSPYQHTEHSRAAILIDIGAFGEENSMSYIYPWPEGLGTGCKVIIDPNSYGVRYHDGFVYVQPGAIIAWEPASNA